MWFTVLLYYTIQYLCYGLCILELDYDIFHAFWFACQAWGHMCAFYVYLNMFVCVCVHSSMCMYPWNELWHVPCFPIACQACEYMDFCNTAPNQILMLLCSFTVLCSKLFCSTFLSRNGQNCNKQTDNCTKLITKCIFVLQITIHICLHKPEKSMDIVTRLPIKYWCFYVASQCYAQNYFVQLSFISMDKNAINKQTITPNKQTNK